MAAGDSFGGATPPISNFFGDKPTHRDHGHDGHRHRRPSATTTSIAGQTYLRNALIPLRRLPVRLREHRRRRTGKTPAEWSPSHVFKFGGGVEARHRRLHERSTCRRSSSRATSIRSRSTDSPPRSMPRRRRLGQADRRDRRHRPRGRDRRDARPARPVRSSTSPTASRTSTRSSATTPTCRSTRDALERRPGDREPQQGPPLHPGAARHRPRQGRRRLQDRRLPQAVGHRRRRPIRRSRPRSTT